MNGRVGRLRLRCTAGRAGVARAMRVRTRLEGTARHHLPSALDPALATERRVYVDRLAVRLDFAVEDYDDVTVAALWAARVRSALELALREGHPAVRAFEGEDEFIAGAAAELAERGELSWVFEELGCGTGAVAVLDFLFSFQSRRRVAALSRALVRRPSVARALHRRLDRGDREIAVAALRGHRRWGDRTRLAGVGAPRSRRDAAVEGAAGPREAIAGPAPRDGARTRAGGRPDLGRRPASDLESWLDALAACARSGAREIVLGSTRRAEDGRGTTSPSGTTREAEHPPAPPSHAARSAWKLLRPEREHVASPRRVRRAAGDADPTADRAADTRFGGIAFLYPWLGEYLDRELPAPTAPPGLDPAIAARAWALASLVAPETSADAVVDPLVWLLAGGLWRTPAPLPPPPEEQLASPDRPAAELLARFADLVPGFEDSSPQFIRERFLSRDGTLLELDRAGAVVLRLAPDALDAVLGRLPYPRGPFRLAWSPIVQVEVGQ